MQAVRGSSCPPHDKNEAIQDAQYTLAQTQDFAFSLISNVNRLTLSQKKGSFNPKNKVTITLNEVLEFVIVTEFGTKNVIFVTRVTNCPCNLLIINLTYRVQK